MTISFFCCCFWAFRCLVRNNLFLASFNILFWLRWYSFANFIQLSNFLKMSIEVNLKNIPTHLCMDRSSRGTRRVQPNRRQREPSLYFWGYGPSVAFDCHRTELRQRSFSFILKWTWNRRDSLCICPRQLGTLWTSVDMCTTSPISWLRRESYRHLSVACVLANRVSKLQ
jgi:hypothetical protein